MAGSPFGPWGRSDDEVEPGERVPVLADPFDPTSAPVGPPVTGTWIDEFLPIYWLLARPTDTRGAFSQAEVDAMDLSTVAALLGQYDSGVGTFEHDSLEMIRRRIEAAEAGLPAPTWEELGAR